MTRHPVAPMQETLQQIEDDIFRPQPSERVSSFHPSGSHAPQGVQAPPAVAPSSSTAGGAETSIHEATQLDRLRALVDHVRRTLPDFDPATAVEWWHAMDKLDRRLRRLGA